MDRRAERSLERTLRNTSRVAQLSRPCAHTTDTDDRPVDDVFRQGARFEIGLEFGKITNELREFEQNRRVMVASITRMLSPAVIVGSSPSSSSWSIRAVPLLRCSARPLESDTPNEATQ